MDAQELNTLRGFTRRVSGSLYERLRVDLWPASDGSSVPTLDDRIEWVTLDTHSEAMHVDNQAIDNVEDHYDEPPARIGFINLNTYSNLEISPLRCLVMKHGEHAAFIVRREYDVFFEHAMACARKRFFVTGTSGIGLSFGCCYFLFRLLALGQPVFLLRSQTETSYFSSDGVQASVSTGPFHDTATFEAIEHSWVLIDIHGPAFYYSRIYEHARCIIWTASPGQPGTSHFVDKSGAETWYMKTWSPEEIAAVTQRFKLNPHEVQRRLDIGGPIARTLFTRTPPGVTDHTLMHNINIALDDNIFRSFYRRSIADVLRIEPLVTLDSSGRAHLERSDCSVEFLSTRYAEMSLDRLQIKFELLQKQLAALFYITTLAGKVVEGLMHRALERGMKLPRVFGPVRTVAHTLILTGNPETFVCESTPTGQRPLYLRPNSRTFAAVDAVLVTDTTLGLIQTSLDNSRESYILNFGTILRIMSRLADGARVAVDPSWDLIFCLVGTSPPYITRLVDKAKAALAELQQLNAEELGAKLSVPWTEAARERISKLRVLGYTFHPERGFEAVA
ncbi:hypothetical protein MSAN_01713400 [Mycena sanguinolenta]|uniref:Uncharacterized protein n=1 Tax=Mycena sanguinolenta TaxID=230812 RepID=A0A8H7CSZ3_9AGAR|nr:hypothetical protein MSAN_01713400 [Mycena sanguinolenta]